MSTDSDTDSQSAMFEDEKDDALLGNMSGEEPEQSTQTYEDA